MEEAQKHIVFDMSLLVKPNPGAAVKKLGALGIAASAVSGHFDQASTLRELFGVVNLIQLDKQEEHVETLFWEGEQVPPAMISWFKGNISSADILSKIKEQIKKDYSRWTAGRMYSIADMAFDPIASTNVLTPCAEIFTLIKRLQRRGHTVHVLGNWHSEVREKIIASFREFNTINGKIYVSGDLRHVKCKEHAQLYETFLAREALSTEHVCFVEKTDDILPPLTQLLNASSYSIPPIIETQANTEAIKAKLKEQGLLTKKK